MKKLKNLKRLLILIFISILISRLLPISFYSENKEVKAANESVLTLDVIEDIFISPSTSNGNRRMLFVGTYTDSTICGEEGCPPVYSDSYSLLKFNTSVIPSNTIIINAKLKLYHYGSNADVNLKVSKVDSAWNELSTNPGPTFSTEFGQSLIPSFNTSDPNLIAERIVNISADIFDDENQILNGLALSPVNGLGSLGAVFCSHNPDGFCQETHMPKLEVTYIPNNPPLKPVLINPINGLKIGGDCDLSSDTLSESCNSIQNINFKATNIIDSDPASGALNYAKIQVNKTGYSFMLSPNLIPDSSSVISFATEIEDGDYDWFATSYDKKEISTSSEPSRIIIDNTPPSIPMIQGLAETTKPANNQINLRINSTPSIDNTSQQNEIKYRLQYSTDTSFSTDTKETEWQNSSNFLLTQNEVSLDKNYFFRIKAKDLLGNISDWSETSATTIEGLPMSPVLNKSNWGVADGIHADGNYPEKNRFNTSTFVTRSNSQKINGKALQNNVVEIYVNNKLKDRVIANQNCRVENNKYVCDFNYELNLQDSGLSNSSGSPLNLYSLQLRAIDENQNISLLSTKTNVYHDKLSPKIDAVDISTERQYLNVGSLTNGSKLTMNIVAEKYSDLEFKLLNSVGKVVDYLVWKVPANKSTKLTADLKQEGNYKVQLTAIDAAGNRSGVWEKSFVRDTTAPKITTLYTEECEGGICLNIGGELNSFVTVNQNKNGRLVSTLSKLKVVKFMRTNYNYSFIVNLNDEIGNMSSQTVYFYKVQGGVGATNNDLEAASQNVQDQEIVIKEIPNIYIDIDKNFIIENESVFDSNSPLLIEAFKDLVNNKNTTVYGYTLRVGKIIEAKTKVKYQTRLGFGDALERCHIDVVMLWVGDFSKDDCVKSKSGKNVLDAFINVALAKSVCFLNKECIKQKLNEFSREEVDESEKSIIYKVSSNSIRTYINDFCYNECLSASGDKKSYFESNFTDSMAPEGSSAQSKSLLTFEFTEKQKTFNFNIISKTSNTIIIPSATYSFNEPVGFPFRNFQLTKSGLSNINDVIGGDRVNIICSSKIECTDSYRNPGDIRIERGSYDLHTNSIDFNSAVSRQESDILTPIFATADGEITFSKNYGYYAYNPVTQKCSNYTAISMMIKTRSGKKITYYHLNPKTLELDLWRNSYKNKFIKRGELIGFMGNTGCSQSVHLHYQIDDPNYPQIVKGYLSRDELQLNKERLEITTPYLYDSLKNSLGINIPIEDVSGVRNQKEIQDFMKAYKEGKPRSEQNKLIKF